MEGMYDIHCHAIPGVDDGAPTIKEALDILKAEYSDGVRNIILTPHFRRGMFETPRSRVRESFDELKRASAQKLPDLRLYLGCEFHVCADLTEYFKSDDAYLMAGTDYVLLEFSGRDSAEKISACVYEALSCGYIPIIAHAERYDCLCRSVDVARRLARMGAKIQINADSIIGREGFSVKRFCRKLIDEELIYFVGSDAHDVKQRAPRMGECAKLIEKKYGRAYMERLFVRNPADILDGR